MDGYYFNAKWYILNGQRKISSDNIRMMYAGVQALNADSGRRGEGGEVSVSVKLAICLQSDTRIKYGNGRTGNA
jgi:hypothetical protein